MLRFDHMPSDFHPIFLFLGTKDELAEVAQVLEDFSENPREIDLREAISDTEGQSQLKIVHAEGMEAPYGMRPTDDEKQYQWVLNAWQAGEIAKRVRALTPPELKSGNDIVEMGLEGEIPVKFSRGEFTDNFLTPKHHLHPDYQPEKTQ